MKILLVNDKYIHHAGGGAQESVRILAESLAARGHEVSVLATTYRANQKLVTETHAKVQVSYLPIANVYWPHGPRPKWLKPLWHAIDAHNPVMARRVGKLLDEKKPDVVHTNILAGFSPAIWREASLRGIPVVHTLRDYYLLCPKGAKFKNDAECKTPCASCKLYSLPKKQALKHVDAVVAISRHILREHAVETPIQEVIHNSYQADGILPARPDYAGLKVGYLGRLCPTKGIELLLEAVRQTNGAQLYIAGNGSAEYVATLRQRASAQTTFLGTVSPQSLFEKIDVLVVPSLWHEPFGRVAIEALAWGIPVLASQRGGLPEIVQHGVNGWIFEPNERDSLVRQLRQLTWQHCQSLREACLKRAQAFLPDITTGKYEQLYQRVMTSRKLARDPKGMKFVQPQTAL